MQNYNKVAQNMIVESVAGRLRRSGIEFTWFWNPRDSTIFGGGEKDGLGKMQK